MGIWQNLVEGYNLNPELSRVDVGGLFPLSSTTISNQTEPIVVISLDENGGFIRSEIIPKRNDKKEIPYRVFAIPVTQESLNRTRESYPHPIFDQREYVFPEIVDGKQVTTIKNRKYKEQLREFSESLGAIASIKAIMHYVSQPDYDFNSDLPEKTKLKTFILFRVFIPGKNISDLWIDPELFQGWHNYYSQKISKESPQVIDAITGCSISMASFHPKKILTSSGNAKLVSSNDKTNFTFRGLFTESSQAVSIGYETSQKAHQFLRYLIVSKGIACGEQVIVPFTQRNGIGSLPPPPVRDEDLDLNWDCEDDISTADIMPTLEASTGIDYAETIRKVLHGKQPSAQWKSHATAAIVILEAATPGRLSITYYRELTQHDYLEQVQKWHERCKWPFWFKSKDTGKPFIVFGAPSFDRILQAAFGWSKSRKDESYEKLKQRIRLQLIRSVFDGSPIPLDYISNAIHHTSNPLGITINGKFDKGRFFSVLTTTCSLLKSYYHNTKESFDMSIDLHRTDRDYLYGRLLGAADKLEEYALYKKDNTRSTAAIRYMQTFSMRPFTTWRIIHDTLLPYIQQVKNSFAFREIQTIMEAFNPNLFNDDSPLSGLYLAGYYHEREHLDDLRTQTINKYPQSDSSNNTNLEQE